MQTRFWTSAMLLALAHGAQHNKTHVHHHHATSSAPAAPAGAAPAVATRPKAKRMPPIPCREDLAMAAEAFFNRLGRAIEIGVFHGVFSRHNMRQWSGHYTMVDYWAIRPDEAKGVEADNFMGADDQRAAEASVREYGSRATLVKALSLEAAKRFPPAHFDWIYVDALHTYDAVLADLRAWWPKLRPGGLLSGDDYGDEKDTFFVSAR